ncbi:putative Peroxidase 48 [Cornus florida]|uniref:putative Peroxidase 48 n=1 Tax=Cornus florida TaxID=4283 RepID=UPI00289FEE62|nr:putative Peroxidase 48 [Cornus florida]
MMSKWVFLVLIVSVVVSLRNPKGDTEPSASPSSSIDSWISVDFLSGIEGGALNLEYDFYRETCPNAARIVRSTMSRIVFEHRTAPAQLLRLLFHDCFIEGCDASVLLDDSNGNKNHSIEKDAIPNKTLKGFNHIDLIKEELEEVCPGVVSCADILVLATRDGVLMAGGLYYPVLMGRRDSDRSYFQRAMAEIPKPDGNVTETLRLFGLRGFSERETVALLGSHNIGKIGCEFIQPRLNNFLETGQPDPTIAADFIDDMITNCGDGNSSARNGAPSPIGSSAMNESNVGMGSYQEMLSSISSGSGFDSHYYQSLLRGRGLLFADQQLMANEKTAEAVRDYAADVALFRMDFARAMVKLSSLGVLTESQGQVRHTCSLPVVSNKQNLPK